MIPGFSFIARAARLVPFLRRRAWQREWEATYRRLRADEFQTGHSDQHAAVVDAVAARDPAAAAEAMRRHLETIDAAMRAP